jgi:hypothetical protein
VSGRPILVTGSIRSGTTWVGRIMGQAPGVAVVHEPFNVDHPTGQFAHHWRHQYTHVDDGVDGAEAVATAMADTLAHRYRPWAHLRAFEGPLRAIGLVRDLPSWSIRRFLTRPRTIVKDPIAVFATDWLARRFDMDVVVMVRHPAAFVWSYLRIAEPDRLGDLLAQPDLMRGPLALMASSLREAARSSDPVLQAATLWRAVYGHLAGPEQRPRHVVVHESLCADPLGGFSDLFGRVGLAFGDRAWREVVATTSSTNPVEAPPGVLHRLHRHSAATSQVWRWRLSNREVDRIRAVTEDVACRFYPADSWLAAA